MRVIKFIILTVLITISAFAVAQQVPAVKHVPITDTRRIQARNCSRAIAPCVREPTPRATVRPLRP